MNNDSAISTVERCLERIREFDGRLRAWEHVDEEGARSAARILDEQAAAGSRRGPLHGIPIGIKDIIDVAGMPTRAGSPLRAGHMATEDAPVVAALRAAGAVILGKTVTCEFACFDPAPTRNPWNLERTPGGSSSGSAAAVATGMCPVALGTQTGGSVIRPAAYCGIVGFKPTFDAISCEGVVPFSGHLDHIGFFGQQVIDVARLASAVCVWPAPTLLETEQDSTDSQPRAPRLAVLGGMFRERADAEVRRLFTDALRHLPADVEHRDAPQGLEDVIRYQRLISACDALEYHRAAFQQHPTAFGPKISSLLREAMSVSPSEYQRALDHQRQYTAAIEPLFEGIDALVMPATPTTAPGLDTTGDPLFNSIWSYVGTPAVCVPCGLDSSGMPAALQFVGRRGGDEPLLLTAQWYELNRPSIGAPPI